MPWWFVLPFVLACARVVPADAQPPPPPPAQPSKGTPRPSGALKAYKGPEGELVVMIEVNDGKEMLVHFRNLGRELEGQTRLYLLDDRGRGDKQVFLNKKRGSKWYEHTILVARSHRWTFYPPTKPGEELAIRYSDEESKKYDAEGIVKSYRP